jgi:UDP-N-acetylmuramyl pentapeptide synthase
MKAALRTLAELDTDGKRIAVLGAMGELGAESERGHREVGEAAAQFEIDQLITTDETSATIANAARRAGLTNVASAKSTSEAAELLADVAEPGDLVLVKGSRSARTERVIEAFEQQRAEVAAR